MKRKIKEEDGVQKSWYFEATHETMTMALLPEFLRHLTEDYEHDYGTIVHAIAAGMGATMTAMNHSEQGHITGFQAQGIMWMVLDQVFHIKGPARLLQYENMLYPQYEVRFRKEITPDTWAHLQRLAAERLATAARGELSMASAVRDHMQQIVDGVVPFGHTVTAKEEE